NRINAAGSAYVFQSTTTNVFDFTSKLVASDRAFGDLFGSSVSIYNKYAVVGAIAEDEDARGANTFTSAGSVYLFINDPKYYDASGAVKLPKAVLASSAWFPYKQIKLVSTDRAAGDWFGYAVAVNDSCIIIGTPLQDNDTKDI